MKKLMIVGLLALTGLVALHAQRIYTRAVYFGSLAINGTRYNVGSVVERSYFKPKAFAIIIDDNIKQYDYYVRIEFNVCEAANLKIERGRNTVIWKESGCIARRVHAHVYIDGKDIKLDSWSGTASAAFGAAWRIYKDEAGAIRLRYMTGFATLQ